MQYILNSAPAIGQPYTPVQIRTAGKDVVATGSVITADPKNLEIQVADLRVVFSFETDGAEPKFGSARAEGSTLHLTLFNFNNPLSSGTASPISIGKLHGRTLLLTFSIFASSPESLKTFHFTFLLGDAA